VSESDNNIIFVGQGEETVRGNTSHGNGIWNSVDAGRTWEFAGLKTPAILVELEFIQKTQMLFLLR